ncbi:MAG: 4-(cytidine 5'-diphospho)-2-C-methyl-D-erythritol kinase [Opitutales bacterium]|nr:4-(cytidine 5'-diphospho)-2-C-methyl-D-erythritol kinase [Opitutales bacterium]
MKVAKFSPAKVNLMLAITGVRPDGFHNLVSLVAPVKFGDELLAETAETDSISCDMEGVPLDGSNLVMKAAELFRQEAKVDAHFKFRLEKRVPHGAGLGGGSSNGAAALNAANELCGNPLSAPALEALAAKLGSDCPLFLSGTPVVMRGRGELVCPLFGEALECVSRLKIFLFKPDFSINTGWAYSRMRANPSDYIDPDEAESLISVWLENPGVADLPLVNNMQIEAFKKYPALELAVGGVREKFGIPAMMSGSGSACFAIVNALSDSDIGALESYVKSMLGESCFTARAF